MSMIYCHEHDRHVDTDYGPCPECEQTIANLELEIEDMRKAIYIRGCSDDYYYTRGTGRQDAAQLLELCRQLRRLQAEQ